MHRRAEYKYYRNIGDELNIMHTSSGDELNIIGVRCIAELNINIIEISGTS
jgi:hypothetical protein